VDKVEECSCAFVVVDEALKEEGEGSSYPLAIPPDCLESARVWSGVFFPVSPHDFLGTHGGGQGSGTPAHFRRIMLMSQTVCLSDPAT